MFIFPKAFLFAFLARRVLQDPSMQHESLTSSELASPWYNNVGGIAEDSLRHGSHEGLLSEMGVHAHGVVWTDSDHNAGLIEEGGICHDGASETCFGDLMCGESGYSATGYQCCSDWKLVKGVKACVVHRSHAVDGNTFLRDSPFLMSHNATTGYAGGHMGVANWVKTQSLSLPSQLSCGVRALDMRVVVREGNFDDIRFHHSQMLGDSMAVGWISELQSVGSEIPHVVEWGREHPEELVIMSLSHCHTSTSGFLSMATKLADLNCGDDQLIEAFTKLGVRATTSCDELESWTLDEAKQAAEMEGGGRLLLILGEGYCVNSNFDDSVVHADHIEDYIDRTMQKELNNGKMFQVQAFEQQVWGSHNPTATVPLNSEVNAQVLRWLHSSEKLAGANFLEMNLICSHGPSISSMLGATVTGGDLAQCAAQCQKACVQADGCLL